MLMCPMPSVNLILSHFANVPLAAADWLQVGATSTDSGRRRLYSSLFPTLVCPSSPSSMSKTVQDLVSGTAGGIAQVQ